MGNAAWLATSSACSLPAVQMLPFTRIKKLGKDAADIKAITEEATIMMTRATASVVCAPQALPCLQLGAPPSCSVVLPVMLLPSAARRGRA